MYSDLFFITIMEDLKFDVQMGNRLYSFFLELLVEQKDKINQNEDEASGSIWEYWDKEL
ncbi:hypothetical protein ACT3CE_08890 [Marinifilum sp. RC60d5]|uniref:hypothetical protein n=1 Tax=Marinifilum sp. RC60d5 TaxID=3458414 RepID=UPI004036A3DE